MAQNRGLCRKPDFLDALVRGTPRRGGAVTGAWVWRAPLRDNTGSAELCLDIFPVTYSVCSPTVGLRRLIVGVVVSASPHALPQRRRREKFTAAETMHAIREGTLLNPSREPLRSVDKPVFPPALRAAQCHPVPELEGVSNRARRGVRVTSGLCSVFFRDTRHRSGCGG